MFVVPFLICAVATPSGPRAIELQISHAAVPQNLLPASTCILHAGRIVATPGRSFFGAGSAEIPRLLRFRCWKNRPTFLTLREGEPGEGNYSSRPGYGRKGRMNSARKRWSAKAEKKLGRVESAAFSFGVTQDHNNAA